MGKEVGRSLYRAGVRWPTNLIVRTETDMEMMTLAALISEDYAGGECEVLSSSPSLARLRLTPQDVGEPVEFEISAYRVVRRGADQLREDPGYPGDPSVDEEVDLVWVTPADGAWDGPRPVVVSPVSSAVLAVALR